MGHAICLQPWNNISASSSQTLIQDPRDWLDLAGYQDAAVYFDLSQMTAQGAQTSTLYLETAPERDETIFTTSGRVVSYPFTLTPTLGLQTIKYLRNQTLHRFLRWSWVFGTVNTSTHFRIWLNLNQAGW